MITSAELREKIRVVDYRLKNLADQREENATEQNWTVVKGIKEQERTLRIEKKTLESCLTSDDFMNDSKGVDFSRNRSSSPE
jgi:hypothetical protein